MYNDNKIIQKIMKLCNEKQKKSEKNHRQSVRNFSTFIARNRFVVYNQKIMSKIYGLARI